MILRRYVSPGRTLSASGAYGMSEIQPAGTCMHAAPCAAEGKPQPTNDTCIFVLDPATNSLLRTLILRRKTTEYGPVCSGQAATLGHTHVHRPGQVRVMQGCAFVFVYE